MCYKSDRRKNCTFEKRRQNEDKHLHFHLHNTLCLPKGVHEFHTPKSSSCLENSDEKCPSVLYRSDTRKN